MKTRSSMLLLLAVVAAAAFAIAIGARRVRAAHSDLIAVHSALVQTERDVRTIVELRAQAPSVELQQRPTQDVIAQVNQALAEVGIPSSQLQALSPEGDGGGPPNVAGGGLRQQSIRLTLRALSPAQVGSFLAHWHGQQEVWSANRLEMVHNRESPDGNLYDATIVITAKYISDPPPAGPSQPLTQPSPTGPVDSTKERL